MPALKPYFAKMALDRVLPHLTPAQRDAMVKLLGVLQADGNASVADIHQTLFPLTDKPAANKALTRLLEAVNNAAEANGIPLKMAITNAKRGPRNVWFEGPMTATVQPALPDLNAISENRFEAGQRGMAADEYQRAVVLLTFNENESAAVVSEFSGNRQPSTFSRGRRVYNDFGMHGDVRVLHSISRQGPHLAQQAAQEAISEFSPLAVIAVGIAFGMDDKQQAIGDVLVSESIRDYALDRKNSDGTVTLKEIAPPASSYLLDRMTFVVQSRQRQQAADWPKVRVGCILSGPSLVDNLDYRNSLREMFRAAIGGEMESTGLATACERAKVDWLVVKAISDWGDGTKGEDKDARQKLAATNAARVVKALFDLGPLYADDTDDGATPGPASRTKKGPRQLSLALNAGRVAVPHYSRFGLKDVEAISHSFVGDALGELADLSKNDFEKRMGHARTPAAQTPPQRGIEVLPALSKWVDEPDAPRLFALLGEYGMGKTITSQQLTLTLCKRHAEDPTALPALYFDLRHVTGLDRGVPTLKQTIEECIARGVRAAPNQPEFNFDVVLQLAVQGALIVFDGLDEVLVKLNMADGQTFTNNLLKLLSDAVAANATTRSKMLITCRTQYFRTLREQKTHFTGQERGDVSANSYRALVLLPFTAEQVRRYLASALPEMDVDAVMAMVASVHDLTDLTRRPYTLKLVSEYVPEIEAARAAGRTVRGVTLYRAMAQRWLERDSGKHHIKPEHKLRLAMHLAAEIWRSGARALPASQLETWFHRWLESEPDLARRYREVKADQLEEDLRTATFLRRDDTGGEKLSGFRFAHSSLQEFFLAEYLVQAIRDNARERWVKPKPSMETFDFVGQLLEEADDERAALLETLHNWRAPYQAQASETLLAYALHAHQSGAPVPDLQGIDMRGANLSRWPLYGVGAKTEILSLGCSDFRGANLRESEFYMVDFQEARFDSAELQGAEFNGCNLKKSVWQTAQVAGAVFRGCYLEDAMMEGAVPRHTAVLCCDNGPPLVASALGWHIAPRAGAKPVLPMPEWLEGHQDWVRSVAYAPDGKKLASAGNDGTVRLWDAESGKVLRTLQGHQGGVWSVVYAPDGKIIASSGDDGTVRLWDAASGKLLRTLEGHQGEVGLVAYAPDGNTLASAGRDGMVHLWDAASGKVLLTLKGHKDGVGAMAHAPDGKTLASADEGGSVRLWDKASGKVLRMLKGHQGGVASVAYTSDGKTLASADEGGAVRLWDTASGKVLRMLEGHHGGVLSLAYAPDGKTLASAGDDGTVRLWDVASGKALRTLEGHQGGVGSVAYAAGGKTLASAGDDGTVRLWDAVSGKALRTLEGDEGGIWSVAYAPDGKTLASAGDDGTVRLCDAASGKALRTLEGHQGGVWSVAYAPDGQALASAGDDGTVRLWDASGKALHTLRGHKNWVLSVVYAPDGKTLASAGDDGTVRLWDAVSGKAVRTMTSHRGGVWSVVYTPDGNTLASAAGNGTVLLWDVASGKALRTLEGHRGGVGSVAYAPDGKTLASAGDDGTVRLWDAVSGKPLRMLEGHHGGVLSVAYAPDGKTLASAGDDGTVRLWDAVSGKALRILEGYQGDIWSVAYAPDGKTLVSAGGGGTVRLWDATSGESYWKAALTALGHATFDLVNKRLVEADGEAWRYLFDLSYDEAGNLVALPWEMYGELPKPTLFQAREEDEAGTA